MMFYLVLTACSERSVFTMCNFDQTFGCWLNIVHIALVQVLCLHTKHIGFQSEPKRAQTDRLYVCV